MGFSKKRGLTTSASAIIASSLVVAMSVSTSTSSSAAPIQEWALAPSAQSTPCGDVVTSRDDIVAGTHIGKWKENLIFDRDGVMWVSNFLANKVTAYDQQGHEMRSVNVKGPGGIALAPNGHIHVLTDIVLTSGSNGTIASFDPTKVNPTLTTIATGLRAKNGMAMDAAGNHYVTTEGASNVARYGPDGKLDERWTAEADITGTNGIAIDGDTLYVGVLVGWASPLYVMPAEHPDQRRVLAKLSPGLFHWRGLDDITVIGDFVYATSFVTGELIRVNKTTGDSCVLATGLSMPTSVRAPLSTTLTAPKLFVTQANGAISLIEVNKR